MSVSRKGRERERASQGPRGGNVPGVLGEEQGGQCSHNERHKCRVGGMRLDHVGHEQDS